MGLDVVITEIADPHEDGRVRLAALASLESVMCLLTDSDAARSSGFTPVTGTTPHLSHRFGPAWLLARGLTNPRRAPQRRSSAKRRTFH
jgi:hypothetical protein